MSSRTRHRTDPGQTSIASDVSAVLPTLARKGQESVLKSQARRKYALVRTTFCPVCGGNKTKEAIRCVGCRDARTAPDGTPSMGPRLDLGACMAVTAAA